jgi:hypothetical protein
VVLPPLTENLNTKTIELLEAYVAGGGKVLCCGDAPTLVDGVPSGRGKAVSKSKGWKQVEAAALAGMLLDSSKDGFAIRCSKDDEGILLHHRRQLDDGEILFLVNTSIDEPSCGEIESAMRGVEHLDAERGSISPYAFETTDNGIKVKFELAPCGSLLLFLSKKEGVAAPCESKESSTIAPIGALKIRRKELNVLTLDYVDITVGPETTENVYFYNASHLAFKENGMERNPWDNAVQLRDEIITKKFAADSGFEATYRFTIEGKVPAPLYIVIERPDLYTINCNGKAISPAEGKWWLDRSFGKIDITRAAKTGENTVTIKASPMTIYHELESAYVLGDFALKPTDSGFVIIPDTQMELGQWNDQGHPFYGAGVSYAQDFDITEPKSRYVVSLADWYGSVAKVVVNGKAAGYIYHQPWECDVTELINSGTNTIEVTVIGTLRNTLGPHHGKVGVGSAWPQMFQRGPDTGPPPGEKYFNIGYGLFKPFELHRQ